jgi:putative glycosyltransferase
MTNLSIVTTLYQSAPYLKEFLTRVNLAAQKITQDFEIVLVNDGSPDESLQLATSLFQEYPNMVIVDLSRNFGHHKAMMTGLEYAKGERVFLIDCDLEEEPEWLVRFYDEMTECNVDVVYGQQQLRRGCFMERAPGHLFYWVLRKMSDSDIPSNMVTARLMSRRYVNSLIQFREQTAFIYGLWHITGYSQFAVQVTKKLKGLSTYTLGKKFSVAVNAITSFSEKPLVYIFYLGAAILSLSAIYIAYLIIRHTFYEISIDGWTSIIVSIWFMGGLIIFVLGVIGIYLSRIFIETKQRPYTIVRAVHRLEDDQ